MSIIKRVPIAMSALALGVAGLGNLLASYSPLVRPVCGAVAASLVALIVLRVLVDSRGVAAELSTPAGLAVLPALFMATMLLSTHLQPWAPLIAVSLWLAAIAAQLLTTAVFARRYLFSLDMKHVLPSWFLIFVGYVVASVTSPAFSMEPLGRALLYAGLLGYVAALVLITYRVARGASLPEPALPTLAIYAAPPSLCLAGYLAVTADKQPAIVYALLAVSVVSMAYVLTRLPRILRLSFCPSCAALAFPFVITAIALKQSGSFLATNGDTTIPAFAIQAAELAALAMVVYVFARYVMFLATPAPQPSGPGDPA
ncbi:MAG: C4-dicarboxylate ABC transporter [Actinobacteria bacterium HGW-Actinobacteria-10]|jgi:exfoliative toxin A/B|nr:MAG: C4-dicarboxylate ABC transporter [Actinobacteria bacterium HGW-Actinobacteria-10]